MTDRIVQVLELRQKRCNLRFGVGACEATGTPKCFQTFHTCKFRTAYNTDGEMRWYFHRQGDPVPYTADRPSDDEWYAPSIPLLQTVTTEASRLNVGAIRENESPFGLRGKIKIQLDDFQFRNQVGDFYADERDVSGSFGALLLAWLGEAAPQLEMYLYQGVKGQSLAEMTVRRYDVTNINPPSGGMWEIEGFDPLYRALRKKAEFPRETDLQLVEAIDENDTTIEVSGTEEDVSDDFGNTSESYLIIGDEIIQYEGYTGSDGVWSLSNVVRGVLNTTADSHDRGSAAQRVGHFENYQYWRLVHYVLTEHTTIPDSLIPFATEWTEEGNTWLPTLKATGTYVDPIPVEDVCAEAMRDGQFSIWWDEREQEIKMIAVRQPTETPTEYNETSHIIDSKIVRKPDERFTRMFINYDQISPIEDLEEFTNYKRRRVLVDGDKELDVYADGTIRARRIFSRLMRSDSNAILVAGLQSLRFTQTPKYLQVVLSDKDSDVAIGDVVSVSTEEYIDTLGDPIVDTWQVIEWEETKPGEEYRILAQAFDVFERPSFIMENSAPDFASATDAEKEDACYITENDGTMPDGSTGYVIQ